MNVIPFPKKHSKKIESNKKDIIKKNDQGYLGDNELEYNEKMSDIAKLSLDFLVGEIRKYNEDQVLKDINFQAPSIKHQLIYVLDKLHKISLDLKSASTNQDINQKSLGNNIKSINKSTF